MKRTTANKLFAILTAALLLLSVLPLAAAAADEPAEPTVTLECPPRSSPNRARRSRPAR